MNNRNIVFFQILLTVVLCLSEHEAKHSNSKHVDRTLKFKKDGTFKIVQFTDLHYGEQPQEKVAIGHCRIHIS